MARAGRRSAGQVVVVRFFFFLKLSSKFQNPRATRAHAAAAGYVARRERCCLLECWGGGWIGSSEAARRQQAAGPWRTFYTCGHAAARPTAAGPGRVRCGTHARVGSASIATAAEAPRQKETVSVFRTFRLIALLRPGTHVLAVQLVPGGFGCVNAPPTPSIEISTCRLRTSLRPSNKKNTGQQLSMSA